MKFYAKLLTVALLLTAPLHLVCAAEATHNFDKWEKEIAAYEQTDLVSLPPKGCVLFIGSSHCRRWVTLAKDFPQYQVINRGFGGSMIMDATHFAPRIIFPYAPRSIYLRAGGNDLASSKKSVEQVFADYQEFVATVHAKLPKTYIIFISNPPSVKRWAQHDKEKAVNTLIADYVKGKDHLRYIEIYDLLLGADGLPRPELLVADQLHFTPETYQLVADRVRPDLAK